VAGLCHRNGFSFGGRQSYPLQLLYCFSTDCCVIYCLNPLGLYAEAIPFRILAVQFTFHWSPYALCLHFIFKIPCASSDRRSRSGYWRHNLLSSVSLRRSARVGGGGSAFTSCIIGFSAHELYHREQCSRAVSSPYRRTESLFYFQA